MRRRRVRLLAAVGLLPLALSLAVVVPAAAAAPAGPRHPVRDWNVSADGASSVTTASGGAVTAGDTLVAYVEADAAGAGSQTATVSGCGQTWHLLARENAQAGDTETWQVTGAAAQSSCKVKAVLGQSGYQLSLTAADYMGAGVPSATMGYAASGAAAVTVSLIPAGSALWLAGNDWDNAISRTLLAGDTSVHQKLSSAGDTYWTEQQTAPANGTQTIGTSAPAGDQWNAVAVVIPPASQQQPPAAPTGLTAGTTTATTVPLSVDSTRRYGHRLLRVPGGVKAATVTSGTSYTDTGLAPSTQYTYTVSAYNSVGRARNRLRCRQPHSQGPGSRFSRLMAAPITGVRGRTRSPNSIVPVGVFPAESLPANLAAEGINYFTPGRNDTAGTWCPVLSNPNGNDMNHVNATAGFYAGAAFYGSSWGSRAAFNVFGDELDGNASNWFDCAPSNVSSNNQAGSWGGLTPAAFEAALTASKADDTLRPTYLQTTTTFIDGGQSDGGWARRTTITTTPLRRSRPSAAARESSVSTCTRL